MKLFLLSPNYETPLWGDSPFDYRHGLVIRASSPEDARELAASYAQDEGPLAWTTESSSFCTELLLPASILPAFLSSKVSIYIPAE